MVRQVDYSTSCYSVRSFTFPRTANIVIGVLAAFVVVVNTLAMISVLKNYRRLRQRIYVFVISLAAADILAGIAFLANAIYESVLQKRGSSSKDITIFHLSNEDGEKFVGMKNLDDSLTQELFETFKVGVVVLSVLSTALMTFALYKRTTSMGRHHEDFKNMNTAMGADSNSFLPAFDTMMRVLSIGTPGVVNGMNKNMGRGSEVSQSSNDSPSGQRTSVSSRMSKVSHRPGSSVSKDTADTVLLEKFQDGQGYGARTTQVIKISSDSQTRKSNSKRKASVGRLINNTGRRVSHAFRGRTASGGQSYVGRHSYSVMSKGATRSTLFLVWIVFVVTCMLPPILRRSGSDSVVCPAECHSVELFALSFEWDGRNAESTQTSRPNALLNSANSLDSSTTVKPGGQANVTMNKIGSVALTKYPVDVVEVGSPNGMIGSDDVLPPSGRTNDIGPQKRPKASDGVQNVEACFREGGFRRHNVSGIVTVDGGGEFLLYTPAGSGPSQVATENSPHSSCSSCSPSFFPMSKSHMIFVALVVLLTWCWLIVSASRLLYLRKHSTNVFVRCSALWRFMFLTGIFYLVTLLPYVAWIILDFATASPASKSPLWYGTTTGEVSILYDSDTYPDIAGNLSSSGDIFSIKMSDSSYFHPLYGIISSCLLMVNLLVLPSLYLIRLLGFRRIISAL